MMEEVVANVQNHTAQSAIQVNTDVAAQQQIILLIQMPKENSIA